MTSHPKINPKKRPSSTSGFTLLEIVIVLAVVSLVIGGAITALVLSSSQRKLSNISGEIEVLAKKARAASILHQTPYAIEFREDSITLLPLSEAGNTDRKTSLGREIGGTDAQTSSKPAARQSIPIDPELSITIRHWNTAKFITPTETVIPVWRFDPEGLSEPITIRINRGEDFTQDTYNPLNASIAETESIIH